MHGSIAEAVLLVDDDRDIRETLSELLDASGYAVLQAENGQIALDVLKTTPRFPCVVVLDLSMPVLDGREFLRLRASDPIFFARFQSWWCRAATSRPNRCRESMSIYGSR